METLDLSAFDTRERAQEGVDMPLLDPKGYPTGATVRVRGMDSQVYKGALEKFLSMSADLGRKPTQEERDAEFLKVQANLVAGWHVNGKPAALIFEKGGEALECTPANVARVLRDHAWVEQQVSQFAGRRANFLPGPASS